MVIKYTPEVKRILKASGMSESEIATAEVKATQEQKKVEAAKPPTFQDEEEEKRWEEKMEGPGLEPIVPRS